MVVGLGGLGCAAAQYLAASGIGHLTLIDGDCVDLSNLQRQVLHYPEDIDKLKVESVKNKLLKQNPDIKVENRSQFADEKYLRKRIADYDVIVDCSDNYATRCLVNKYCFAYKVPLVSGAAIRMEGQLICFNYADGQPCYECMAQFFGEQHLSCVEAGILSPVVGVMGSLQAVECIKFIAGIATAEKSEKKQQTELLLYDGLKTEFKKIIIMKDPHCKICQTSA